MQHSEVFPHFVIPVYIAENVVSRKDVKVMLKKNLSHYKSENVYYMGSKSVIQKMQ